MPGCQQTGMDNDFSYKKHDPLCVTKNIGLTTRKAISIDTGRWADGPSVCEKPYRHDSYCDGRSPSCCRDIWDYISYLLLFQRLFPGSWALRNVLLLQPFYFPPKRRVWIPFASVSSETSIPESMFRAGRIPLVSLTGSPPTGVPMKSPKRCPEL